jgi:phospholipid/cholesterol/gamma-HCH transport system substrate-binding protein
MNNARQAALGLFVLCGMALALAAVVLFGKFNPFRQSQSAQVVFEGSVEGLGVGAPVTFRGVHVGVVSSIVIENDPKTGHTYVPVTLRLDPGKVVLRRDGVGARPSISELVAAGLRADVLPVSLISGESEVNLDFLPLTAVRLHPGIAEQPEIPVSRAGTGTLAQQLSTLPLQALAKNAGDMMRSIRRLADTLTVSLPQVLDSTRRTSVKAGETLDAARTAILQIQRRADVTMAGIDRLTGTANQQLSGRGADLRELLVSSNAAVLQARGVLGNLKGLTDNHAPARVNLEESLNDLAAASSSLRALALDLEENPRLLITGRRQ